MSGKYLDIDVCEHVLHDLRGGCSGCNYDVESIIGHLERKAAERDRERELADTLGKEAATVMAYLEEHGPSIVPHLMDTDDNPGERLREALRQWREARKGANHE